ncbi:MAG: co-chaperone GroES, partial [Minisyncoccia bacterium]
AVGRGTFNSNGQLIPLGVKVDDEVIFRGSDWDKEKIDGEEYYVVSESSIVGIIK